MSLKIFFLLCFFGSFTFAQSTIESDVEFALQNAKKGVYWALSNIPVKKSKIEHLLIDIDKLISHVKLSKEINGVRIESTGYFGTNELTIIMYRSKDSLIKDGFLKKDVLLDDFSDD